MLLLNKTGKKGKEVDNLPQILQYITGKAVCSSSGLYKCILKRNTPQHKYCERWSEYNVGKNVHLETTVSQCLSLEEVLLLDKLIMLRKFDWVNRKIDCYYHTYFTDAANESHASLKQGHTGSCC